MSMAPGGHRGRVSRGPCRREGHRPRVGDGVSWSTWLDGSGRGNARLATQIYLINKSIINHKPSHEHQGCELRPAPAEPAASQVTGHPRGLHRACSVRVLHQVAFFPCVRVGATRQCGATGSRQTAWFRVGMRCPTWRTAERNHRPPRGGDVSWRTWLDSGPRCRGALMNGRACWPSRKSRAWPVPPWEPSPPCGGRRELEHLAGR